jgi:hypothetical protein
LIWLFYRMFWWPKIKMSISFITIQLNLNWECTFFYLCLLFLHFLLLTIILGLAWGNNEKKISSTFCHVDVISIVVLLLLLSLYYSYFHRCATIFVVY